MDTWMKSSSINDLDNFIAGWYVDPSSCDYLVDLFEANTQDQFAGALGHDRRIDTDQKDSIDFLLGPYEHNPMVKRYYSEMSQVLENYKSKYRYCNDHQEAWGVVEPIQIQKYNPGQGFHAYHYERQGMSSSARHLVFMTYLNDVTDGGETEFFYQNLKVKPEQGLTIIWPSDWMFTHKGITSLTQTKYIVTGYYSYYG